MTPKRIQLSRQAGWRMPPNTVKVDRSTRWGNPFKLGMDAGEVSRIDAINSEDGLYTPEDVIEMYRWWLTEISRGQAVARLASQDLRGKNLACWCKPGALCHADVLLEVANK